MLRIVLPLLLAFGIAAGASAQTTPGPAAPATANPYSATVPVAGTSDVQRSAAIAVALTQVLQQVSPGYTASPDVLAQASGYVRDFHYSRAAAGNGLELQVEFDPGAIGRLVAQGSSATPNPAGATASTNSSSSATAGAAGTPAPSASGSGTLWVDGLENSHAFASLLALLRGDSQLQSVVPIGADSDGVLLRVGYNAPLATVLAGLETPSGHLSQAAQPHSGADASLHWTP